MNTESRNQNSSVANVKTKPKKEIIGWIKFFIGLFIFCFLINNAIGLTIVSGHSMDASLKDGSILFINKLTSHVGKPNYGDVVVIKMDDIEIIKRVIALPGDTVSIQSGTVYVNGSPLPEIYTLGESNDIEQISIGGGHVFVLGDNRTPGESLDSRNADIGPVLISNIKGYANVSILPFYKIMKPLKL
jgi:signal peptidase I